MSDLPHGVTVTRTRSGRWRVRGQGGSRVYRTKRIATASIGARPSLWMDVRVTMPISVVRFTQSSAADNSCEMELTL